MEDIKIEGISRTKYNLENYTTITNKKIGGKSRLIHVSIPGYDGQRQHFCYCIKMINNRHNK